MFANAFMTDHIVDRQVDDLVFVLSLQDQDAERRPNERGLNDESLRIPDAATIAEIEPGGSNEVNELRAALVRTLDRIAQLEAAYSDIQARLEAQNAVSSGLDGDNIGAAADALGEGNETVKGGPGSSDVPIDISDSVNYYLSNPTSTAELAEEPDAPPAESPGEEVVDAAIEDNPDAQDVAPSNLPASDEGLGSIESYRVEQDVFFRLGPSNDAVIGGVLTSGDIVRVVGRSGGWLSFFTEQGERAFVYQRYLTPL